MHLLHTIQKLVSEKCNIRETCSIEIWGEVTVRVIITIKDRIIYLNDRYKPLNFFTEDRESSLSYKLFFNKPINYKSIYHQTLQVSRHVKLWMLLVLVVDISIMT